MGVLRALLIIWLFWWAVKKLLNFFGNQAQDLENINKTFYRSEEFKRRNMDVQDAEYEEIDESR